MATTEVVLSEEQSKELSRIAQSRSLPAGYVFRARLILMLAEGATFSMIQKQLRTTAPTIIRWKVRFLQLGMDGLDTHHPGQSASVLTPALRAKILSATRKKPGDGSTRSGLALRVVCLVSDDELRRKRLPDVPCVVLRRRIVRLTRGSNRRSSLLPPSPALYGTSQVGPLQRACELGRDARIAWSS